MPAFVQTPPAAENMVMNTIRQALQYESQPENMESKKLPKVANVCSQYELLKLVYSKDANLGNTVLDVHMMRHPMAMEKQRELFGIQPGLLPLLIKITLDKNHPLRGLDEYEAIINLIDRNYPTIEATQEEIIKWSEQLDVALLKFLDCSLICAVFSVDSKNEGINDLNLLPRLDTATFSPTLLATPSLLNTRPPSAFQIEESMKKQITSLGNINVHGVVSPAQEKFIVEIAKAHKYFLARKITIVKNLESNPKFAIGMYNVVTKLKDSPAMFIGYRIDGETSQNIPEIGLDFKNIHPVICVHEQCHVTNNCSDLIGDYRYIYIKVNTVYLGYPPLGARNTVNFDAMRVEWSRKSLSKKVQTPTDFDPLAIDKQQKKRYRKKKGTNLDYKMIWEERYLRFVVREYKKKNDEDEKMMESHLMPYQHEIGSEDAAIRLDGNFSSAYNLFMPVVYQKL